MSTLASRLGRALFIVPAAHYNILDTHLQLELYELFHQKTLCRLGHALCTPLILLGIYLLVGRIEAPVSPLYGLSAVLFVLAIRLDVFVGMILLLPLAAMHNLATSKLIAAEHIVPIALGLVLGGTLLQTLSHAAEDIPPPTSGTANFMPVRTWLHTASFAQILTTALLSFFVFTLLELWASTRIWPLQVMHLLMRFGYRPELRRDLDRRVRELASDPQRMLGTS